jgi:hypothetical protein
MKAWIDRQIERIKVGAVAHRRLLLVLTMAGTAVMPLAARADIIDWFWNIIASLFLFFTSLLGFLLILVVKVLVELAQYSNFVAPGPTMVQVGWVVVRDLVNMFFILILLIMAFAIILGVEKYGSPKTVRDLFIMAIVVNFSKTICGIFIDMGQVIMLTFVNGFAQAAGGNFLNAFQINRIIALKESGDLKGFSLAMAAALAFMMVAVALCVVIVMMIQMAFRIVMLWILIILSPLAFLGRAFEPMKKDTYDRWWGMFKGYITKGPIIAFFLWLALLSAQRSASCTTQPCNIAKSEGFVKTGTDSDLEIAQQRKQAGIPSDAASDDAILSLVIIVCILIGGMKVAGEGDNLGTGAAKWFENKAKAGVQSAKAFGYRNTVGRAKNVAKGVAGAGLRATQSLALRGAGKAIGGLTGGRLGAGMVAKGRKIAADQADSRKKVVEKFTGSAQDRAQANPGRFAKEVANETDPRKAAEKYGTAMKDDKARAALQGDKEGTNKALDTMSKGTDDATKQTYQKAARDNFNNASDAHKTAALDGMDANATKKFLKDNNVKASDIPAEAMRNNPAAADHAMEQMMKNPMDALKAMSDPDKMAAMAEHAGNRLEEAEKNPKTTDSQLATLTVGAIMTGQLTAQDLQQGGGHEKAAGALTKRPGAMESLAKGINPKNPVQMAAGKAAMSLMATQNPAAFQKLKDNGNFRHLMPDQPKPAAGEMRRAEGGGPNEFEPDEGAANAPPLEIDTGKIEEAIAAGGERAAAALKEGAETAGAISQRAAESIEKAGQQVQKGAENVQKATEDSRKNQIIGKTGGQGGGGEKV